MKFVLFRTSKPKKFSYRPRYFNPEKEAMERRKAELGVENELTENEALRARMTSRWRQKNPDTFGNKYQRMSFIVYGSVILGGIYLIFFTDFIDNILHAFGLIK
jgi:hypothetical protein